MSEPEFRPDELLRVLHDHRVRYVLIGGFAAVLHGSALPTYDIDIVPEASRANLDRLSEALTELDARVRVEGIAGGLPFAHDADSLAAIDTLTLVTRAGDLDVTLHPAGLPDFQSWDAAGADLVVLGVPTRLAALAHVVRSKKTADQPKDRLALPLLRALLARHLRPG